MAKLLSLTLVAGILLRSCNALGGCAESDILQCIQRNPAECPQLSSLAERVALDKESNETSLIVRLRTAYMKDCRRDSALVFENCFSPWTDGGQNNDAFERVIARSNGRASFLCKPPLEDVYNVTWTHLDSLVDTKRKAVAGETSPEKYVTISDGGQYHVLVIDRIQRSSEGFVQCIATSHAHTFAQQFHLYVKTDEHFRYPMENETSSVGQIRASFQCYVHFDLWHQDECGSTQRFRWSHKGAYASVPRYSAGNTLSNRDKYFVAGNSEISVNTTLFWTNFIIYKVKKDDEGPVKCEVPWGPGDYDWVAQEAYLTVL